MHSLFPIAEKGFIRPVSLSEVRGRSSPDRSRTPSPLKRLDTSPAKHNTNGTGSSLKDLLGSSPSSPMQSLSVQGKIAVATREYIAKDNVELSVRPGDRIKLHQKVGSSWFKAELRGEVSFYIFSRLLFTVSNVGMDILIVDWTCTRCNR